MIMNRTITVKGIGRASAKVDYVELSLTLEALSEDYNKAMDIASAQIDEINQAVYAIGFEKGSVKTTNFNVRTQYEQVQDKKGNYKREFVGYNVVHNLKLAFDFDSERLAEVLSVISKCVCHPRLSIDFTVKDATVINEEMLRTATANARRKAEILCEASGVTLGELVAIDYNWGELDIYSPTSYNSCEDAMPLMRCKPIDIEPEDIDVNDTVTFVWAIN